MLPLSKIASEGHVFNIELPSSYRRYPKPPYSYQGMIVAAILKSEDKAATLIEIQQTMKQMFAFSMERALKKTWLPAVLLIVLHLPNGTCRGTVWAIVFAKKYDRKD